MPLEDNEKAAAQFVIDMSREIARLLDRDAMLRSDHYVGQLTIAAVLSTMPMHIGPIVYNPAPGHPGVCQYPSGACEREIVYEPRQKGDVKKQEYSREAFERDRRGEIGWDKE